MRESDLRPFFVCTCITTTADSCALWTYSLTGRAWRTVVAWCALKHTTTYHQWIFRYIFPLCMLYLVRAWMGAAEYLCHFILNTVFQCHPVRSLKSARESCVFAPWGLVFLLDLWLLVHREDPAAERRDTSKSQTQNPQVSLYLRGTIV